MVLDVSKKSLESYLLEIKQRIHIENHFSNYTLLRYRSCYHFYLYYWHFLYVYKIYSGKIPVMQTIRQKFSRVQMGNTLWGCFEQLPIEAPH